ncbi:MAG: hypothetical protein JWR38_5782 [Mucilaginibacter sp.]|nr:hypothetical protein [Mucilaginibacter sp.]
MATPMEYIVFEPDQVLTNDHLNETFNYLDQQNRWTRNKLIGIGIVCGLEIVQNPGVIEITSGCGVTSQGYLITQNDTLYTYYMPYNPVDVPTDLPFVYDNGDLPFYKPFCADKTLWLLLSDDQFNVLEPAQKLNAKTLSSAASNFLGDYVVVLFLETKESDLKNCDTQDCNNKGEKMVFQVRPLLVAKNDLYGNSNIITRGDILRKDIKVGVTPILRNPIPTTITTLAPHIQLKRFNVPYTELNNTNDVLNAFVKLVDDATLNQVADAYNYCYQKYRTVLKVGPNPFADMGNVLIKCRDLILQQSPLFIEYFYDFIDDLIKAYDEFLVKISGIISTCCPDENLFPLHLVLGDASLATNIYLKDSYRNYFMYSPLFSKMGTETAEVILLFNRMVLILNDFTVQSKDLLTKSTIKITPSEYELPRLSERAIPYYYKINVTGSELYRSWNYHKTSRGIADFNLSYNSGLYNSNTLVTQPLLYDIEHYNFFRVEGHIGQNYQDVLSNILSQRLTYNLPFDVVAIPDQPLDYMDIPLTDIDISDLGTDYNLIVREVTCQIHTTFCFITKLPYVIQANPTRNSPGGFSVLTDAPPRRFTEFKTNALRDTEPLRPLDINTDYKKGDFMNTYCTPEPNTIGSAYLAALSDTGVFTNPITSYPFDSATELYYFLFQFIDAVEDMMYTLNTNDISSFNIYDVYGATRNYLNSIAQVITILRGPLFKDPAAGKNDAMVSFIENYELDILIEDFDALVNVCIEDRMYVLNKEITDRRIQRADEYSFLTYYKNHPGLEHKAGVPKGGTLVLVYKKYINRSLTRNTAVQTDAAVRKSSVSKVATPVASRNIKLSADLDVTTLNQFKKIVTDSKDVSDTEKSRLIDILAGRGKMDDTQDYDVDDSVVIADFYIPYLCPPIDHDASVIEPPPPPVQKAVITMGDIFCDNDANPAAITVSISGGTFNEVKGLDGTKQTFTPATAGAGSYTIIYTVNDVSSDPFVVTVLAIPKTGGFTFKNETIKGTKVTASFIPDLRDTGYIYNWIFNNQVQYRVGTDGVASVIADCSNGEIQVNASLSISNGSCPSPVMPPLELAVNAKQGFYLLVANDPGGGTSSIKKTGTIGNIFTRKKKE